MNKNMILMIVLVVVLLTIVGILYSYFKGGGATPVTTVTTDTASTDALTTKNNQKADDILQAIDVLKSLSLDTEFFNSPKFRDLRFREFKIPPAQPPKLGSFRLINSVKQASGGGKAK